MLDNELAQIMAMAQSAHNQAAATFAPAPATALAAPLTPQICVRQTITECRPFAAPGAPPRYGGALLAVIQNGGSAAVNNTGLRIGIDAAIAEFPPEIRAFLTANNGHFPPAYILINPFSSIRSHHTILSSALKLSRRHCASRVTIACRRCAARAPLNRGVRGGVYPGPGPHPVLKRVGPSTS